jgi:3-phosphoshikimate 1-carboxyvinyltransferase
VPENRVKTREIKTLQRFEAEVTAPPSKSVTNRALIVAALAQGESRIGNPLVADDTELMAAALEKLGIGVRKGASAWAVDGCGGAIPARDATLDAGHAGTTMRFLTALAATGNGTYVVDGSERMRQRPIGPLAGALSDMGAGIEFPGGEGFPPVQVRAAGLRGGKIELAGEISSQFLSAVLMVAPCCREGLDVEVAGRLVSRPYVDLTTGVMAGFGVPVEVEDHRRFRVAPGARYAGRDFTVEGDYSSASYFFAAAAVTGGTIRVRGVTADSRQGDRRLPEILERMGCRLEWEADAVRLTGGQLRGVRADLRDMPDMAQTLGVVALFAEGRTVLTGLDNLRIKETDRLGALAAELARLGGRVREGRTDLEIEPRPLCGAEIETYGDHRMAMSFAIAGLRLPGVVIRDPGCVAKSYPAFWDDLDRLYR